MNGNLFPQFDNSEMSALFMCYDDNMEVLNRENLDQWLRHLSPLSDEATIAKVIEYVEVKKTSLFSQVTKECESRMRSENAGELIIYSIQMASGPLIEDLLLESFNMLKITDSPLSDVAVNVFKRVVEFHVSMDSEGTASKVGEFFTNDLVISITKHIGYSTEVGGAILELLGAHIMFGKILQPTFSLQLFTSPWLNCGFPRAIVEAFPVALSCTEKNSLVYFMKELCTLGYNPTIAPVVSALLEKENFNALLNAVIQESTVVLNSSSICVGIVPEAIEIFSVVVRLIRQTFPSNKLCSQYNHNIKIYPPIDAICSAIPDFVALLNVDKIVGGKRVLTRVRSGICSLMKELISFRMKSIDEDIKASGFFDSLLHLCEIFPNNNSVSEILHDTLSLVLSQDAKANRFDVLFGYLTSEARSEMHEKLIAFATNSDKYGYAAIRSHCYAFLLFDSIYREGEVSLTTDEHVKQKILELSVVVETELTGEAFREAGSANVPPPPSEEVLNYAGKDDRTSPTASPLLPLASPIHIDEAQAIREQSSELVKEYPDFKAVEMVFFTPSGNDV